MAQEQGLLPVADVFNTAFSNKSAILSANYTPKRGVSALRITVSMSQAARFGFTVTSGSTTTALQYLGFGTVIPANRTVTFSLGCRSSYSYNFQYDQPSSITTTIIYMTVEEVTSGVL